MRRVGVGKALIDAALSKAEAQTAIAGNEGVKCTIIVDSYNVAARRTYEKAGFVVVGKETYVQQPRALVAGETQRTERVGLLMQRESSGSIMT